MTSSARFITAALAASVFVFSPRPTLAQPSAPALVARGVSQYDDLEYEKAITSLRSALAFKSLSTTLAIRARHFEGLSLLALGRRAEARAAFVALLKLKRTYELPRSESKAARDLLEAVRQSLPKPKPLVRVSKVVAPEAGNEGEPINVEIALRDPAKAHRGVAVLHRPVGRATYSSVQAAPTGAGGYVATIPGTQIRAGQLELRVIVSGAAGAVLARSETHRTSIAARPVLPTMRSRKPFYKRWWFWTAIGVTAAAGTTAYVLTRGSDSKRAGVTISFDFGQL